MLLRRKLVRRHIDVLRRNTKLSLKKKIKSGKSMSSKAFFLVLRGSGGSQEKGERRHINLLRGNANFLIHIEALAKKTEIIRNYKLYDLSIIIS